VFKNTKQFYTNFLHKILNYPKNLILFLRFIFWKQIFLELKNYTIQAGITIYFLVVFSRNFYNFIKFNFPHFLQ